MSPYEDDLHVWNADEPAADEVLDVPEDTLEAKGISAKDPFGLYLHQMGTIPRLSRDEELALAAHLDRLRRRYRHAVLASGMMLDKVAQTFERIQAGDLLLERNIDEIPSLGLTAQQLRLKLPKALSQFQKLLEKAREAFQHSQRGRTVAERAAARRQHHALLRKLVTLAEALSPRTELIDSWVHELREQARRTNALVQQLERLGDTAAGRTEALALRKELRELTLRAQLTPEDLNNLLRVI